MCIIFFILIVIMAASVFNFLETYGNELFNGGQVTSW